MYKDIRIEQQAICLNKPSPKKVLDMVHVAYGKQGTFNQQKILSLTIISTGYQFLKGERT